MVCAASYVPAFIQLLISLLPLGASAYGSSSTVAPLWGSADPIFNGQPTFTVCVLEIQTQSPRCWGTVEFYHDDVPPGNIQMWAISAGAYFVCGLDATSYTPICWGLVNTVPDNNKNKSYSSIASGVRHVCAVQDGMSTTPGKVDCWGDNEFGESTPPNNSTSMVSSGLGFSCGLDASTRKAVCWGADIENMQASSLPQPDAAFLTISAGESHVCGLELGTQRTLCWGNNTSGQAQPPTFIEFFAISAGSSFTCGLRKDTHEAVCWGDDSLGQLSAPAGVPFASISASDRYSCGVVEEGSDMASKVLCWGLTMTGASVLNSFIPANLNVKMKPCVSQCVADEHEALSSPMQCLKKGDKICLPNCNGNCTSLPPSRARSNNNVVTISSPLLAQQTNSPSMSLPSGPLAPMSLGTASSTPSHYHLAIALSVAFVSFVSFVVILGCACWKRKHKPDILTDKLWSHKVCKTVQFDAIALQLATKNYRQERIIGKGAFGTVYRGILPNGQDVAIKKSLLPPDIEATTFEMELQLLSRLHHRDLVNLVGYCQKENALVFEYMANGSLQDCLFCSDTPILTWKFRVQIILQAARGLEYLHVYASPKVIHRDVKPGNILLDKNWNAHLSDFGLSLDGPITGVSHLSHQICVGTEGYVDPDCSFPYKLTAASDVYSFGVVMLEVLSGRPVLNAALNEPAHDPDMAHLVQWVERLAKRDELLKVLDARVLASEDVAQGALLPIIKLALQCVRLQRKDRPSMSKVVSTLQTMFDSFFVDDTSVVTF